MNKFILLALLLAVIGCKDHNHHRTVTQDISNPGQASPVPEPCSMALLGSGLAGVGVWLRKRGKK